MGAVAIGKRFGALPLPFTSSTSLYVLRSCMAAALALCVGLYLHLDSPFSAASTVLLLVNPVQGAVVGKGLHRIAGTLVGAVAAFVLVACFAQQMILMIVGVGIWLGLV
ncbi:MAG: FUSC family protein [Pseudomonas sp.]|uniref:FUSC family protein n=1 Tax=Pseudomonas sp. TaxID=306 RepID=UPI003D09DF39